MTENLIQIAIFLIRAALAAVLVAAGAAKLVDMRSFAATLTGLGVPPRPASLIRWLALIIPLLELGLGIALVSGLWPIAIICLWIWYI
jgi:uncharacterized membrane protein YphA (DoxX/SURF4 family)